MTQKNESLIKSPAAKIIIAIIVLSFAGTGYCFSQSNKPEQINITKNKKDTLLYLNKDDSVFLAIKTKAANDLKQSSKMSDPESSENKLKSEKVKTWPKEKQNQLQDVFRKSIYAYNAETKFDVGIFMLVFGDFGAMDLKDINEKFDFRVQSLGGDKYAAEFWEDLLIANSEANALVEAAKMAKRFPDDKDVVENTKVTYAKARKSIADGKEERYSKVMVLLYTREKDGSVIFHDPFQSVIDFK